MFALIDTFLNGYIFETLQALVSLIYSFFSNAVLHL